MLVAGAIRAPVRPGSSPSRHRGPAPAARCRALRPGATAPDQLLSWLVLRWRWEVTVGQTCHRRGVATPRRWSDPAIERTTPALLGRFFSMFVTRLAHPQLATADADHARQAAGSHQSLPTFRAALV